MNRGRARNQDGTAWLAALLLLALVVLFALAWQAYDAARNHRRVADGVLRDYAGLAADELMRRCLQATGYSAAAPLLQQLTLFGERAQAGERRPDGQPTRAGALTSPATLAETGDPRLRDAASIMESTLRLALPDGILEVAGRPLAPTVEAWVATSLADPAVHRRLSRSLIDSRFIVDRLGDDRDREIRMVFSPVGESAERVYGFVLDTASLGPKLSTTIFQTSVLPPSLGADAPEPVVLGNERLHVAIVDAAGQPVLEHGTRPTHYETTWVERAFGDRYGGLLDGWTLRVAIDPEAASTLIIGGLPRSELPMVVGLIILGAALFVGALVQLRRARRLARLRADFVAEVSHELRTPLTQIRMFNEMLLLGRVRSEDEALRAHRIVDREARRLGRLVDNVLAFARRERSERPLRLAPHALAPIVRAVVEEMAPLVTARESTLESRVEPRAEPEAESGPWARVDPEAVHQMLLNLVDNAVKYGPAGQTIRIELDSVDRDTVRVAVTDEGPGVPKRDRARIFDSYHRLDRDRRAAVAGAGIGLSVVRQIAEQHGGQVRVTRAAGTGARFEIDLPRAEPARADRESSDGTANEEEA